MPANRLPVFLALIWSLSGMLYSQSTDDEMESRIRETIRVLSEGLIYRDRLNALEGERTQTDELHRQQLELAESLRQLESQRKEFAEERLDFVENEKVPALVSWGLAWRDAYQAAQIAKRTAWCLWICKRTRKLPPLPIGMEPPR